MYIFLNYIVAIHCSVMMNVWYIDMWVEINMSPMTPLVYA